MNFKHWIQEDNKINDLIDKHELSLFFKKNKDYFGAPENSRIIFAKLKNDDIDDDPFSMETKDQIKFLAINLMKFLTNDNPGTLFGLQDIPQIKICDREEAVKNIKKGKKEKNDITILKR